MKDLKKKETRLELYTAMKYTYFPNIYIYILGYFACFIQVRELSLHLQIYYCKDKHSVGIPLQAVGNCLKV
jgi:hypothetical protein